MVFKCSMARKIASLRKLSESNFLVTLDNAIGIRYDAKNRYDRKFNTTGKEKNPNNVKFYARTDKYADNYKYIYYDNGDVAYAATRSETPISGKFFDMEKGFQSLHTFKKFLEHEKYTRKKDYLNFLKSAKTPKAKKQWQRAIDDIDNGRIDQEIINHIKLLGFQELSDFEWQNDLISELKKLGADGYITKDEIAVF